MWNLVGVLKTWPSAYSNILISLLGVSWISSVAVDPI